MQVKENFLDSKIQVNLYGLLVLVRMSLPKKETLRQCVANMILIYMCPNKGIRELGHHV